MKKMSIIAIALRFAVDFEESICNRSFKIKKYSDGFNHRYILFNNFMFYEEFSQLFVCTCGYFGFNILDGLNGNEFGARSRAENT